MEQSEILRRVKNAEFGVSRAFVELSKIGLCPALLFDDNGHWAVSFSGIQNVSSSDEPIDTQSTFYCAKESWKDYIKDALIYAIEN